MEFASAPPADFAALLAALTADRDAAAATGRRA
jgi:hypothetical protein